MAASSSSIQATPIAHSSNTSWPDLDFTFGDFLDDSAWNDSSHTGTKKNGSNLSPGPDKCTSEGFYSLGECLCAGIHRWCFHLRLDSYHVMIYLHVTDFLFGMQQLAGKTKTLAR